MGGQGFQSPVCSKQLCFPLGLIHSVVMAWSLLPYFVNDEFWGLLLPFHWTVRFCLFSDSSVLRTKDRWKEHGDFAPRPTVPLCFWALHFIVILHSTGRPRQDGGLVPTGSAVPSVPWTPHCKCCPLSCLVFTAPRSPSIPSCLLFQETPTLGQSRKYTHISQRHRFSSSPSQ